MQGPAVAPAAQLRIRRASGLQRPFARHGGHGVQGRPEAFEACQVGLRELDSGVLARSQAAAQVGYGPVQDVRTDPPRAHGRSLR
ncbi:MAG: hypothetical protein V3W32_08135 [Gemmatimonadota bacterium]